MQIASASEASMVTRHTPESLAALARGFQETRVFLTAAELDLLGAMHAIAAPQADALVMAVEPGAARRPRGRACG